jgi:hypothetical protein
MDFVLRTLGRALVGHRLGRSSLRPRMPLGYYAEMASVGVGRGSGRAHELRAAAVIVFGLAFGGTSVAAREPDLPAGPKLAPLPQLHPVPKQLLRAPGAWSPGRVVRVSVAASVSRVDAGAVDVLVDALEAHGRTTRVSWEASVDGSSFRRADIVLDGFSDHRLADALGVPMPSELPVEGYVLDVSPERVVLASGDRQGLVWAAVTLGQLLDGDSVGDGAFEAVPALRIEDNPSMPLRLAHFQVPAFTTGGENLFVRRRAEQPVQYQDYAEAADFIPLLERLVGDALDQKFNGVVFHVNSTFRLQSHPELAAPQAVDLTALAPILARIRRYHAEPIPQLSLFSHQEHFLGNTQPGSMLVPLRAYPKKSGRNPGEVFWWESIYDPGSPQVQATVTDVLDEVLTLFQPAFVHAGHDEAGALRFVQETEDGRGDAELFAESVAFIQDVAARHGARVMVWGDMLLNGRRVPGVAHGGEAGVATHKALEELSRDVILVDWQYYPVPPQYPHERVESGEVPSTQWFLEHGFDVVGASVAKPVRGPELPRGLVLPLRQQRVFSRVVSTPAPAASPSGPAASSVVRGQALGMMACHFYLGPRRLLEWLDSGDVGSLVVAGEHFWNGGVRQFPEDAPAP